MVCVNRSEVNFERSQTGLGHKYSQRFKFAPRTGFGHEYFS
jgi:hypothetical protein